MTTAFLPSRQINDELVQQPDLGGRRPGAVGECRGPQVKLFVPDETTPCQQGDVDDMDLWFGNEIGGRDLAVMACQTCPFRGRCSYNAVAVRATHGIWGGVELPGDKAQRLVPAYQRLLRQFEERRHVEIGDVDVTPLTADSLYLRRREPAA